MASTSSCHAEITGQLDDTLPQKKRTISTMGQLPLSWLYVTGSMSAQITPSSLFINIFCSEGVIFVLLAVNILH